MSFLKPQTFTLEYIFFSFSAGEPGNEVIEYSASGHKDMAHTVIGAPTPTFVPTTPILP